MTLTKLNGNESGVIIAKLINALIDEKASVDLDNLDATGEQRFTDLNTAINTLNTALSTLTTTVNKKVEATVSLASNGYIKFDNGLIIQWGDRTFSSDKNVSASGTYDVSQNYPISFTRVASCNLMNTYNQAFKASVNKRTLTSFTCTLKNVGNSSSAVGGFIWFCIGY